MPEPRQSPDAVLDAASSDHPVEPTGPAILRTIAMPADTNPNGDVFGGWVVSQMDLAGSIPAYQRAAGRIVTVSIDRMSFLAPVAVGDVVSCYADVVRVGRSSIQMKIQTWVMRRGSRARIKVTDGLFTYVAIDERGRPRPVPEA